MTSRLCQGFCCSAQDHKSRGSLFTSTGPTTGTEKTTDKLSRYLRAAPMGKTLGEGRSFALGRVPARIEHLTRLPTGLETPAPREQNAAPTGDRDTAQQPPPKPAGRGELGTGCEMRRCRVSRFALRWVGAVEPELPVARPGEVKPHPRLEGKRSRGSHDIHRFKGVSLGHKPPGAPHPPLPKRNRFAGGSAT